MQFNKHFVPQKFYSLWPLRGPNVDQDFRVQRLELQIEPLVLEVAEPVAFGTFGSVAEHAITVRVGLCFLVRQHRVACNTGWVTRYDKFVELDSIGHVVILTAPTPKQVGETVDFDEMLVRHGTHSAKQSFVWQPAAFNNFIIQNFPPIRQCGKMERALLVFEDVNGHRHVTRLFRTRVDIAIVFWK